MLEENLRNAGLSQKEACIYLAGLKAGPVLASYLAYKTGINRPSVYDSLKSLIKKGLVSTYGSKYKQRFIMEDPKNLDRYLERKKKDVDRMKKYLDMAIPEVNSLINEKNFVPKIKFIEGIEGIENALLNSLDCKSKEILAVIATKELFDSLGNDFIKKYVKDRVSKNKKTKTIRLKTQEAKLDTFFDRHSEQLRELKITSDNVYFSESFFIYDDTVFYISSKKENFGLIIESQEHAEMMKNIFAIMWNAGK